MATNTDLQATVGEPSGVVDQSPGLLTRLSESFDLRRVLLVYTVVFGAYVYLPILSLVLFSFTTGGVNFPIGGFTTNWYTVLLNNDALIETIVSSLQLAFVVMLITTAMATAAALAYRHDFRGKRAVLYLVILGIITPGITYGVGATLFMNEMLNVPKGLWTAVPVHVVWTFPFAFIIMLAGIPPNLANHERAARVMGASNRTVFKDIILPQIGPTVLGAAVFALTLSYNEGTRSMLLLGSDNTMPIYVFSTIASTGTKPDMFALGAATTVISLVLLGVAGAVLLWKS